MKCSIHIFLMLVSGTVCAAGAGDDASGTAADYQERLRIASAELASTRDAVLREQAPLSDEIRQLEKRAITLDSEVTRLKTLQAGIQKQQGDLDQQLGSLTKNLNYSVLLAQEMASTLEAALLAGETADYGDVLEELKSRLQRTESDSRHQSSRELFDLVMGRLEQQLGGSTSGGLSMMGDNSKVCEGEFLHLGPVVYFRDQHSGQAGMAYQGKGSLVPVTHVLKGWDEADIEDVFSGNPGYVLADATGGKALHLTEARGTIADHVKKGGIVGYVIIALGILALLTALLKLWDLRSLSVDSPDRIRNHIEQLNDGGDPDSTSRFAQLKQNCRDLFSIAIRHRDKPRELLEEMMFAYILLQRNVHERRLPMLRVIASAAPLLGLLGTVVGMIKTFTLITVVGTGNAAKLSSGISEALVTTELGLIVAIPTLIIYGYLSHQTEKRLSLLEQYSIELANALQWMKGGPRSAGGASE